MDDIQEIHIHTLVLIVYCSAAVQIILVLLILSVVMLSLGRSNVVSN